jgi:predicted NBD/HSP70 family sugar kinase
MRDGDTGRLLIRGGDTRRLRAYNERLIISKLLDTGPMSKAELARQTGLSGQAASVIVNALLKERLLIKLKKVRGQVGQPSTPVAPNPTGAFSVGVKIGRRSAEAVLVDLLGDVIASHTFNYLAPLPEETLDAAAVLARTCMDEVDRAARDRVVGLGVAIPSELHLWSAELGLEPGTMDAWRDLDVGRRFEEATGLPVLLLNDATAACAGEMIRGDAISTRSALYIYLGTFVGGGVVVDGHLYRGEKKNAGAFGSMPATPAAGGETPQLIHRASVIILDDALANAGIEPVVAVQKGGVAEAEPYFSAWTDEAAPEVARAIVAAMSVIDFQTVVIDGILNPEWRRRFTRRVTDELERFNRLGLSPAAVTVGSIGAMVRVVGAAMMPLKERFSPDSDLLVSSK